MFKHLKSSFGVQVSAVMTNDVNGTRQKLVQVSVVLSSIGSRKTGPWLPCPGSSQPGTDQ
jgi:hypothetical protein